jgi:prevent-host-death family protein
MEEARDQEVVVTNSNKPEAVIISVERYATLKAAAEANDPERQLRESLIRDLGPLRAAGAGDKLRQMFAASPEQIANIVNVAASRKK